jgi:hypothetical protein
MPPRRVVSAVVSSSQVTASQPSCSRTPRGSSCSPKGQALTQVRNIVRRRLTLIEESGSAVAPPILVAVTLWLGLIFASFGYGAPRNRMMVIILLICAASIASALYLILEIDGAVTGLIIVPSEPIQHAFAVMRR